MNHVVLFSGGWSSWQTAKRVRERIGPDADLTLLFTDTLIEDPDLYRFIEEAAADVPGRLVRIADGRDPWQTFYDTRYLGNTRADPCSRILKRTLTKHLLLDCYDPEDTILYFGITWDEAERLEAIQANYAKIGFRAEAPLCEEPLVALGQAARAETYRTAGIEEPRLYKLGFSHNNCFSGETRFITDRGIRTLAECNGQSVRVLGRNAGWKDAVVKSFGVQQLHKLTLRRYGRQREIYTTADHLWFVRKGRSDSTIVATCDLVEGKRLIAVHNKVIHNVRPSAFGIAHGVVYGDGTRASMRSTPASITLCGDRNAPLARFFPLSPSLPVKDVGERIYDLPRYFKDPPPLSESQSYLYGWLAGYFAADGSASGGEFSIATASKISIKTIKDVAARIGVSTGPVRHEERYGIDDKLSSIYTVPLMRWSLREDFFLLDAHRNEFLRIPRGNRPGEWAVLSVEPTDRYETVFCAVVPNGNAFALDGNILTHNCGGFCVKAGLAHFKHLLEKLPHVYAYHEERERGYSVYGLAKTSPSFVTDAKPLQRQR